MGSPYVPAVLGGEQRRGAEPLPTPREAPGPPPGHVPPPGFLDTPSTLFPRAPFHPSRSFSDSQCLAAANPTLWDWILPSLGTTLRKRNRIITTNVGVQVTRMRKEITEKDIFWIPHVQQNTEEWHKLLLIAHLCNSLSSVFLTGYCDCLFMWQWCYISCEENSGFPITWLIKIHS